MTQTSAFQWRERLPSTLIHLGLSSLTVVLVSALVFGVWYPHPYQGLMDARAPFLLLLWSAALIGPVATLLALDRVKQRAERVRRLLIIALLQLATLATGLWMMAVGRPVHLVFEFDRFRMVRAIEVADDLLRHTPAGIRALPLSGPTLLAVRPFRDVTEESIAMLVAQQGLPLSVRPDFWQPYADARQRVLAVAKSVSELRQRLPGQQAVIDDALATLGTSADKTLYLPMILRGEFWTVLLDADTAAIRAYLPMDSR